MHEALESGQVSLDEARQLVHAYHRSVTVFRDMQMRIDLVRKFGVGISRAITADTRRRLAPRRGTEFRTSRAPLSTASRKSQTCMAWRHSQDAARPMDFGQRETRHGEH
ncbi:DUF4004 family protein [Alicyclobacillus acidocaldarius]|uniref:DUF4004 family protein n=1 Tax=Alicyclobacillus acidocaldarius TaxID=405212 RepID=UPI00345E5C35